MSWFFSTLHYKQQVDLEHDFWTQTRTDELPGLLCVIPHMATLNHSHFNSGVSKLVRPQQPRIFRDTSDCKFPFEKQFFPRYTQLGEYEFFSTPCFTAGDETAPGVGNLFLAVIFYILSHSATVTSSERSHRRIKQSSIWPCTWNLLQAVSTLL